MHLRYNLPNLLIGFLLLLRSPMKSTSGGGVARAGTRWFSFKAGCRCVQQRHTTLVLVRDAPLAQGMPSNHTLVIPGRRYLDHRVFAQQQGARGSRMLFLFNDGTALAVRAPRDVDYLSSNLSP